MSYDTQGLHHIFYKHTKAVIIGKLIPAGTGAVGKDINLEYHQLLDLDDDDDSLSDAETEVSFSLDDDDDSLSDAETEVSLSSDQG